MLESYWTTIRKWVIWANVDCVFNSHYIQKFQLTKCCEFLGIRFLKTLKFYCLDVILVIETYADNFRKEGTLLLMRFGLGWIYDEFINIILFIYTQIALIVFLLMTISNLDKWFSWRCFIKKMKCHFIFWNFDQLDIVART